MASCAGSLSDAAPTVEAKPKREPALAKKLVTKNNALLLDVRTDQEFAAGHLEGARQIPHDQVEARMSEVVEAVGGDKSKPVVVYCRSGRRSQLAKETLEARGFTQVVNLGGMSDWPP